MAAIQTARLLMRRIQPTDLDTYYRCVYADPDVMKTLSGGVPLTRAAFDIRVQTTMVDHWTKHGFGPWVLIHQADAICIGHCGLRYWPDTSEVEVLYALDKRYWGQGFASESAQASVRYGIEELHLDYIMAAALMDNYASRRVLEKIGMTYEGTMRVRGLEAARYGIERSAYVADSAPYRLLPDH